MSFLDKFIVGSYVTSCLHLVHFLSTSSFVHALGGKFGIRAADYMDPKRDHRENI